MKQLNKKHRTERYPCHVDKQHMSRCCRCFLAHPAWNKNSTTQHTHWNRLSMLVYMYKLQYLIPGFNIFVVATYRATSPKATNICYSIRLTIISFFGHVPFWCQSVPWGIFVGHLAGLYFVKRTILRITGNNRLEVSISIKIMHRFSNENKKKSLLFVIQTLGPFINRLTPPFFVSWFILVIPDLKPW